MATRLEIRLEAAIAAGCQDESLLSVLPVCEDLHGHFSGSGAELTERDVRWRVAYLQAVIDTWEDSDIYYDMLVRSLVNEVLSEAFKKSFAAK